MVSREGCGARERGRSADDDWLTTSMRRGTLRDVSGHVHQWLAGFPTAEAWATYRVE